MSVFRFYSPLCFVNIGVFRTRLMTAARLDKDSSSEDGGCIQTLVHRLAHPHVYRGLRKLVEGSSNDLSGHKEERSECFVVSVRDTSSHVNVLSGIAFCVVKNGIF